MKLSLNLLVFSLLLSPIGYGTSAMTAVQELLITSFDSESPDLAWQVVNDDVMGGRSVSDFELTEGVLRFFGQTNTNGGGFASLRTAWIDFGLGSFERLALRARTDGRTYTVLLRPRNTQISYRMDFSTSPGEWQEVVLPIAHFQASWRGRRLDRPAISPDEIAQIGIMIADGQDGDFEIEIGSLRALSD